MVSLVGYRVIAIEQSEMAIMAMNRIQFQPGLSMPEFLKGYGTEAQCEQVLEAVRWPEGFRCPRCDGRAHYVVRDGVRKVFQCVACRHQASLIAGTLFQGTKLPLTTWFLAIYLISQAKTGLSALSLRRQLGVSYPTAWLIHHKLMQAMADREERYVLEGRVQVDDAYLGGERTGGKVGRGSENKVPFVAAVSLAEDDRPVRVRLTPVTGFTLTAISAWATDHLAPSSMVFSDGLACFGAVPKPDAAITQQSWPAANPKRCPSFAGSIPSSAISRPACPVATMLSTSRSMPLGILRRSVIASTDASICARSISA